MITRSFAIPLVTCRSIAREDLSAHCRSSSKSTTGLTRAMLRMKFATLSNIRRRSVSPSCGGTSGISGTICRTSDTILAISGASVPSSCRSSSSGRARTYCWIAWMNGW